MNDTSLSFWGDLRKYGFVVYTIGDTKENLARFYNRKEFYKICVITGESRISYANRVFLVQGTTLFFGTHLIPYSWEIVSAEQKGFTCLFSPEFFNASPHSKSLMESPFFRVGGTPIFSLDEGQRRLIASFFQQMISENSTDYLYKGDIIRHYIQLILLQAQKLDPSPSCTLSKGASSRITTLFMELLERQFPIESAEAPLRLVSAQQYAQQLAVHTNYLNRMVKLTTGKTTTQHITQRIMDEAKSLLLNTDWSISEIAYSLGFEYPTYFHNSFKKLTGHSPSYYREGKKV